MIWKALSDSTRRSILSLLKKAPRTTGDISDQYKDLSRYAIMKHLSVLEKADLITVKREGKFRWNHLNPTPIQQTYEKWVSNLIQLKFFTDQKTRGMGEAGKEIQTTKVSIETELVATKERVWKALTLEINRWWLKEFYTSPKTKTFVLEEKLGGLMYEDAGNKDGHVWATVIGLDKPNHLLLKGHLSPALGGPALSFVNIFLEESEKITTLQLSEVVLGELSGSLQTSLQNQWKKLIDSGLKPFVEAS